MQWMSWLRAGHVIGVLCWAGGLLALTRLLAARAARPVAPEAAERLIAVERAVYFRLAAPGSFLALLSGIWLLSEQRELLRMGAMHAKLGLVGVLLVIDHLSLRGIKRIGERPAGGRMYTALHALTALLIAAVAILIIVRPGGGA